MSLLPSKLLCLRPPNPIPGLAHTRRQTLSTSPLLPRVLCAKRTGKQRYPSEKKKLRLKRKDVLADVKSANKFEGFWRLSKLGVPVHKDPGKDFLGVSDGLLEAIAKVLKFPVASMLPAEAFSVVRKSFDARKGGAGTWSDGKLVTRIGRNSDSVLAVMKTLVHFGAPEGILVDGKPHLGTGRLVPLLRNFCQHVQELGVTIEFGKRVDDLLIEEGNVFGFKVSDSRDSSRSNS